MHAAKAPTRTPLALSVLGSVLVALGAAHAGSTQREHGSLVPDGSGGPLLIGALVLLTGTLVLLAAILIYIARVPSASLLASALMTVGLFAAPAFAAQSLIESVSFSTQFWQGDQQTQDAYFDTLGILAALAWGAAASGVLGIFLAGFAHFSNLEEAHRWRASCIALLRIVLLLLGSVLLVVGAVYGAFATNRLGGLTALRDPLQLLPCLCAAAAGVLFLAVAGLLGDPARTRPLALPSWCAALLAAVGAILLMLPAVPATVNLGDLEEWEGERSIAALWDAGILTPLATPAFVVAAAVVAYLAYDRWGWGRVYSGETAGASEPSSSRTRGITSRP